MKSLSIFITLLLLVTANQLAARLRKTGALPVQHRPAIDAVVSGETPGLNR